MTKFYANASYSLRNGQVLERRHNKSNNFGLESISSLGAKLCTLASESLRRSLPPNSFKQGIKKWNPNNCPYQLCQTYEQNIGFIYLIIPAAEIK